MAVSDTRPLAIFSVELHAQENTPTFKHYERLGYQQTFGHGAFHIVWIEHGYVHKLIIVISHVNSFVGKLYFAGLRAELHILCDYDTHK